jgi:hypothetical protein
MGVGGTGIQVRGAASERTNNVGHQGGPSSRQTQLPPPPPYPLSTTVPGAAGLTDGVGHQGGASSARGRSCGEEALHGRA